MQEIVKDSLYYLVISIITSAIFAPFMINFMYRFNQVSVVTKTKQGLGGGSNSLFMRIMNRDETNGTPNMGGVLILIIVPLTSYLLLTLTPGLKVLLIGFVLFGIWGLLDVLFVNAIKENEKLKTLQETFEWRMGKLVIAVGLNIFVTFLLFNSGAISNIPLWKGLAISLTPLLIPLIAFISQLSIYASELTDGEDGLMIGVMGIIYSSIIALLLLQGNLEYIPFLAICLGAIIVDLYFNIPPARFWNGGPGAMPLGFGAFFVCLVTGNVIPYFIISLVTWGILASSIIQIIAIRFFKRRVFKIAPIHHHFKAMGWPNYKVVMRFWLFTVFCGVLGLLLAITIL